MQWTIHRGYLEDPKGLPIADTLIFVKHKERSYEAIAIFSGEHRNVYKKDKDSLFNYLSEPLEWEIDKIKMFMYNNTGFMHRILNKNSRTLEVKNYLESEMRKDEEDNERVQLEGCHAQYSSGY